MNQLPVWGKWAINSQISITFYLNWCYSCKWPSLYLPWTFESQKCNIQDQISNSTYLQHETSNSAMIMIMLAMMSITHMDDVVDHASQDVHLMLDVLVPHVALQQVLVPQYVLLCTSLIRVWYLSHGLPLWWPIECYSQAFECLLCAKQCSIWLIWEKNEILKSWFS